MKRHQAQVHRIEQMRRITKNIRKSRHQSLFNDIFFRVEGQNFDGNILVFYLSMPSYIEAHVRNAENMSEHGRSSTNRILLRDFPGGATTFSQLIDYCYRAVDFRLNEENVSGLYYASDYFLMNDEGSLLKEIELFLASNSTSLFKIYTLALKFEDKYCLPGYFSSKIFSMIEQTCVHKQNKLFSIICRTFRDCPELFSTCPASFTSVVLCMAVDVNDEHLIEKCLEQGADPNVENFDGKSPLGILMKNSYKDSSITPDTARSIASVLLNSGANPNSLVEADTLLTLPCVHCDDDMVQMLLSAGAHPEKCNSDLSLLHITLNGVFFQTDEYRPRLVKITQKLLQAGADPNVQSAPSMNTALHVAASHQGRWSALSWELCEVLLHHGANFNLQNSRGETALFLACKNFWDFEDTLSIPLLLQAGSNPNIPDNTGEYPLHCAMKFYHRLKSFQGFSDLIQQFIKAGFDVTATNGNGLSTLDVAEIMYNRLGGCGESKSNLQRGLFTLVKAKKEREKIEKIFQHSRVKKEIRRMSEILKVH